MKTHSILEKNKTPRLNITSVSGYCDLFLQFNYAETDKKANKASYNALTLLMFNALRNRYKEEGLSKYKDENFHKVTYTDNLGGFCLSIQFENPDTEQQALDITKYALEYVLNFNPDEHNYASAEMKNFIRENREGAKKIAEGFSKDIFDDHSIDFHKEYWNPFA